jgi:hypothetical protein
LLLASAAKPELMRSSEALAKLNQATGLSEQQLRGWLAGAQACFCTLFAVAADSCEVHLQLQKWAAESFCGTIEDDLDIVTLASQSGLPVDILRRYLAETRTILSELRSAPKACSPQRRTQAWTESSGRSWWWRAALPIPPGIVSTVPAHPFRVQRTPCPKTKKTSI